MAWNLQIAGPAQKECRKLPANDQRRVRAALPDETCSHGAPVFTMRTMPTVLRSGPYRLYFYSHEPNEPPHVHVDRDDLSAKFWLDPVALARNFGFSARELNAIESLVRTNQEQLLEAWHGYFGDSGR